MAEAPGLPVPALRVPGWEDVAGLVHGFFGRAGGASRGAWATLNLSERVGDDLAAVEENWRRVAAALPGLTAVRMRQVHGARAVAVAAADDEVGEADALVTAAPGLALTVLTADCVPLLAVAPRRRAVMAVHAGWRGSLAGVAVAALTAANAAFGTTPAEWRIALGPAIGGCCYEVEAALGARFPDRWGAMPDAWQPAGTHGQLDLRRANAAILAAAGVPPDQITVVGPCTACARDQYFSHRAAAGRAGRQASIIGLLP